MDKIILSQVEMLVKSVKTNRRTFFGAAVFAYSYSLYLRRRLSAIMAINSEFVGLPRLFWIV